MKQIRIDDRERQEILESNVSLAVLTKPCTVRALADDKVVSLSRARVLQGQNGPVSRALALAHTPDGLAGFDQGHGLGG